MSERPIQVGDLVMVVRPNGCCPKFISAGKIFVVRSLWKNTTHCPECKKMIDKEPVFITSELAAVSANNKFGGYPVYRLKRIDPDALKDETPTREKLEA